MVTLDLRGEICPYTFVRSKLALEELEVGAMLRVILDHPPARSSVPRSLREEGHDIVSIRDLATAGTFEILARKRL
jgi:tRNA 2-thiouridine synthesizing protein A